MSATNLPPDDDDDDDDIEESLNEALSDLEQMLDRQRPEPEATEPAGEPVPEDGDQYTIPLLDDVVIPGVEIPAPAPTQALAADISPTDFDDEPAVRRRLAERLASEVEVIVQDRVESALESAREEIREQVRNHIDIILPEIVEELIQLRRRGGG